MTAIGVSYREDTSVMYWVWNVIWIHTRYRPATTVHLTFRLDDYLDEHFA